MLSSSVFGVPKAGGIIGGGTGGGGVVGPDWLVGGVLETGAGIRLGGTNGFKAGARGVGPGNGAKFGVDSGTGGCGWVKGDVKAGLGWLLVDASPIGGNGGILAGAGGMDKLGSVAASALPISSG